MLLYVRLLRTVGRAFKAARRLLQNITIWNYKMRCVGTETQHSAALVEVTDENRNKNNNRTKNNKKK
jgi:hypothetical protein